LLPAWVSVENALARHQCSGAYHILNIASDLDEILTIILSTTCSRTIGTGTALEAYQGSFESYAQTGSFPLRVSSIIVEVAIQSMAVAA
jgi:hypothetical protein